MVRLGHDLIGYNLEWELPELGGDGQRGPPVFDGLPVVDRRPGMMGQVGQDPAQPAPIAQALREHLGLGEDQEDPAVVTRRE